MTFKYIASFGGMSYGKAIKAIEGISIAFMTKCKCVSVRVYLSI